MKTKKIVTAAIRCPTCGQTDISRHGQSATGKKQYIYAEM
ncbi:IS1 family transposase [Synechococcus sp. PCC 7502]